MGMTLYIPHDIILKYLPFILNAIIIALVLIGFRKEVFKK